MNKPLKCSYTVPLYSEPGSFGFIRKNHIHEGIDLYCADGEPVYAIEDGIVSIVTDFTGVNTNSSWWNDTMAVFITGSKYVIVYGEITPVVYINQKIVTGQLIGYVKQVLKKDKGRPMSMLHLELRNAAYVESYSLFDWSLDVEKPVWLLDPIVLFAEL